MPPTSPLARLLLGLLTFMASTRAYTLRDEYIRNKTNILSYEYNFTLGANLQLTEDEQAVNQILMGHKLAELDDYFENPERFSFAQPYFTYRDDINKSKVYQIIKRMPKGAVLHIHGTLALDVDYFMPMTYQEHLYVCGVGDNLRFYYSEAVPKLPCPVPWILLSEMRAKEPNFDCRLRRLLSMKPQSAKRDLNTVWKQFNNVYLLMKDLIMYRPNREKYFYDLLKKFYDDNVLYIEFRGGMHKLYELDGTEHGGNYMLALYRDIVSKFQQTYPDFVGIKFIVTKHRLSSNETVKGAIENAISLQEKYPEFIAGFDLVGQEDKGVPLSNLLPILLEYKDKINYFFHAGETNWYGSSTDENLADAIMLGSKRIGHAYALMKHPYLMQLTREQNIGLEVNLLSNIVLGLVQDVRNHPLAMYLAIGLPVILSSDDPGPWGADPISHDFYIAFVGAAHRNADLRLLKQLVLNSIEFSTLADDRKVDFLKIFEKRWELFLKIVNCEHMNLL